MASIDDGKQGRKTTDQRAAEGRSRVPADMSYRDWQAVYVDKSKTLAQWQAEQATRQKDFKTEIEALRQTLAKQRAAGATAADIEQTLKAAGKLVAEEVQKVKPFDLPPDEKIDLPLLQQTRNDLVVKMNDIASNAHSDKSARKVYWELYDVYVKVEAELNAFKVKAQEQNLQIAQGQANQLVQILSRVRSMGAPSAQIKAQFAKSSSKAKPLLEQTLSCYPTDWIEASIKRCPLKPKVDKRGYYDGYNRLIVVENQYKFDTGIHEFGHRMEDVKREILDAEAEFYSRRTKGEQLEKLSVLMNNPAYADREVARKDKFLSPYMGKDYGGRYYELVSMGFEYAYTNPAELLKDTDMAEWIYGLLALI